MMELKDFVVTPDEKGRRQDICDKCPELIQFSNTCKQCGCFMTLKTKFKTSTCPLDKW